MNNPDASMSASRRERSTALVKEEGLQGVYRRVTYRLHHYLELKRRQRQIERDAARIVADLRKSKGRGLFVDCGSNVGQGFSYFSQYFPLSHFDYVLVEPNPFCAARLRKEVVSVSDYGAITLIEAAAGVEEGTTIFYGLAEDAGGKLSEGGSILSAHNSKFYIPNESAAITVRTFSFSEFLADKAPRYGVTVVKMDIEGGEYAVLPDMLKKNVAQMVSHWYIEFHSQYMTDSDRQYYEPLERRIKEEFASRHIAFTLWR